MPAVVWAFAACQEHKMRAGTRPLPISCCSTPAQPDRIPVRGLLSLLCTGGRLLSLALRYVHCALGCAGLRLQLLIVLNDCACIQDELLGITLQEQMLSGQAACCCEAGQCSDAACCQAMWGCTDVQKITTCMEATAARGSTTFLAFSYCLQILGGS